VRRPPVRYARVGGEHVAYQVVGEGPQQGVALTSWVGAVDAVWEHPSHLRIWRSIWDAGRILQLDHRGVGASDAVPLERLGDIDEWVEDLLAVLDDAEMQEVGLMAEAEQVAVAVAASVRHPDRFSRLALVNDRGWAADPSEAAVTAEVFEDVWGTGQVLSVVPDFEVDFAARVERMAASPGVAAQLVRSVAAWDVGDLLPQVEAPTLVLHMHGGLYDVDRSRRIAAAIPGSDLVEKWPTSNWWGDGTFEAVVDFLFGEGWEGGERDLAVLLFTDIVGSTERVHAVGDERWRRMLDVLDELAADRATRHRGRVVKQTGDGHLLEFVRPTDALAAAVEIRDGAQRLEVEVRAGVHLGEIERRDSGDVGGLAVHVAARIMAAAGPGEVLVSRSVSELATGAGNRFEDRGDHELKGVPTALRLFAVTSA
jgi:class 3 adenylate cyclase